MKDEDILDLLKTDLSDAQDIQDEIADKRESYYKAFRGDKYGNEREGWSQSVAPVVWTNHQSRTSALLEIFSDEFFVLKSENDDLASKFQKLIRYQMFRKQDGSKRLYDFLYNAGLYPYAVFKVYHKEDYDLEYETYDSLSQEQMLQLAQDKNIQVTKYEEVESVDPMTQMPSMSFEKVKVAKKIINYSGPCFETLPPWGFGYSPDCKMTEWGGIDGRLVYHGPFKLTLNDIRKRERAGIYREGTYDKCKDLAQPDVDKPVDQVSVEYDVDEYTSSVTESQSESKNELSRELNVKECYCKIDIDNDGLLEPCIVVLIEDEVIAQVEENPYKRPPFRLGGMLPEPHKVAGIAPPSKLENDQKVMTNLVRFVQDQAAMSTYRNVITSDVRMQQMLQTRKPFDVIMGDPQKMGEVPVQTGDQFILKAIELLKGDVEESTGDTRYNQGSDSDSLNKTATGISLISQASARRLRMSAKLLGNGPITGVVRDFIFINQKWRNDDPIRLLGTDIVVNPEDLDGEYDIEIDIGVSPAEKQAAANQLDLLIQFGTQAGIPMGIMTPMHLLKAQKKKYSQLNINVDDLLTTEQQFAQNEEMKKQQAPKEDWREFVAIDKLYPMLARSEQMQILQKLEIQPDPNAQVAGIPQARDMIAAQSKQGDAQLKAQEAQQKMQMEREKHQLDMSAKQMDVQANAMNKKIDLESKIIQSRMKGQNGQNAA
jgi:hypothetical protein